MLTEIINIMKNKERIIQSTVLDTFPKLTSDKLGIRLNAGITLLKYLKENNEKDGKESTYSLQRIIRGLGSSQSRVRAGYYSVLVAILSTNTSIAIETVLEIIKKQLSTGGSNSKGENADICVGQIMTCGAIIQSELFMKVSKEEQQQILEILVSAGKKRSYLPLACYTFLVELLNKINDKQFRKCLWPIVSPEVQKPLNEQTLDTLYFLCAAKKKFPSSFTKQFSNTWEVPDIIHEKSLTAVCKILLNIPMLASLKHPVYSYISQEIVANNIVKKWCIEMDKLLEKPTRNMFLITVTLLIFITENLSDTNIIPYMIKDNFLNIALRTFKNTKVKDKDDDFLNKMDAYFNVLKTSLQKDTVTAKTKVSVLKKLLFYPGNLMFEQITRSKLIQQIASSLDADGIKELVEMYMAVVLATKPKVCEGNETERWQNTERIYAAQLIVKLLGHTVVRSELNWRLENIKVFLNLGLFKDNEQNFVSAELAVAMKDCFYHALDQKFQNPYDMCRILSSLIHYINENVFTDYKYCLRKPFSQEESETWVELMKLISKLENKENVKQTFAIPIFRILFLHMSLHLFKDFEMAQNILNELRICFQRIQTGKESTKGKTKEASLEDNEPMWIEVLIDLFLTLLSHESHLLRTIINCVFPHLCPFLSLTNIHQILDILNPKNDENLLSKSKGKIEYSSDDDSDNEDDENEDEKDSSSEESETPDMEAAGNETFTDKVRMAVRDALHKTGYQTDDESEDLDNMDEEEGKRLNKALSNAFEMLVKNKTNKRKQTKEQQILLHFRVRVLDLIDMYLDAKPAMLQCLEIAHLLLQTLEFSIRDIHQKPLLLRLRSCLKKFRSIKKFESTDGVSDEFLADMLNNIVDKGSRSAFVYKDMSDIIAHCSIFIIRCSQILSNNSKKPKKDKSKLAKLFSTYLEKFFHNRDCLIPLGLFSNVLQVTWDGNWNMVSLLMTFVYDDNVKIFKRDLALELLTLFYSKCKSRISDVNAFKKKIASTEKLFSSKTIELFNTCLISSEENKIKERFVSLLFTLLKEMKTSSLSENINWSEIGKTVQEYRTNVHFTKPVKNPYVKLCKALSISPLVNIKVNENAIGEVAKQSELITNQKTEQELKNEKKRKRIRLIKNEKRKLKKETNLLRLKANSEGMSDFAFDNIILKDIKNESADDANENGEPEMKKPKLNSKIKKK